LTKFSNVTLIHRRNEFRASKVMIDRVLANNKINIIYDSVITQLIGSNKLESIICQNIKTNETFNLPVDGLFYGLGLKPNTNLFKNVINLDSDGYIIKNDETMTNIPGIFVAGDASDKVYRQAVVAAADGCKAALDVCKYLSEL